VKRREEGDKEPFWSCTYSEEQENWQVRNKLRKLLQELSYPLDIMNSVIEKSRLKPLVLGRATPNFTSPFHNLIHCYFIRLSILRPAIVNSSKSLIQG
jgi:hypothetical protein